MSTPPMGRRGFLGVTGVASLAAVTGRIPEKRHGGGGSPLRHKGVNYDTDKETWRPEFVRTDMRAIREVLNGNAVILLGSDLTRLTHAAACAAEAGLFVWIEARQFDRKAEPTLRFLRDVARMAEGLRRRHRKVGISVGCELTIFMDGLVPGKDYKERGANLSTPAGAGYNKRLNAFLARAVTTVRPLFGGWLTYSSGEWERVHWEPFDAVGVDLYRDKTNAATYVRTVRELKAHGKPVIITEFGCCTYRGADQLGGSGFEDVIEWTDPPRVKEGYVRDEGVQARYIGELLDIYESERLFGAFIYDFVDRDSPHSPTDPSQDFDLSGFSLVKVRLEDLETGRWEPKLAFHTVARHFA